MMKQGLSLVVVLGLVGTASALEINLFWSTTGINEPSMVYSTALTNFEPYFVPPTPVTSLSAGTSDLFLWGQFSPDWIGYQIYGWDNRFEGNATHDVSVAYRQRWGSAAYQRRWEGSAGIALDGVMAAVGGHGISYDDGTWNLVLPEGRFLLGAAHVTGAAGQQCTLALDSAPDGLGIACRDPNGNEVVPYPTVNPATVWFTPEPASLALALSALLWRRR